MSHIKTKTKKIELGMKQNFNTKTISFIRFFINKKLTLFDEFDCESTLI